MDATTVERENGEKVRADPTEVEVYVTFTRREWLNRVSIDASVWTDLNSAPRNKRVYRLTIPVPEGALDHDREVDGEVVAAVEEAAGPCNG